jgi:DNA polymerase
MRRSLRALRDAAQACRACPLWEPATQVVFGAGPVKARVALVGEAPGDKEDLEGHPFVGPAGRELDAALEAAGIAREDVYLTNTVKHFKFEERGKRRIHQRPTRGEVKACSPWLDAELDVVRPDGILGLGATAAARLTGAKVRVTRDRGEPLESPLAAVVMVTIHPSAILRARDEHERTAMRAAFAADVVTFAETVGVCAPW